MQKRGLKKNNNNNSGYTLMIFPGNYRMQLEWNLSNYFQIYGFDYNGFVFQKIRQMMDKNIAGPKEFLLAELDP